MKPVIDFEVLRRVLPEARKFEAGETIFRAGDAGIELFVIKSGTVNIRLGDRTIETLGPSEIFGEMALVDAKPRSATVVAATDCELIAISEKYFLIMIREAPYFGLGVMRVLAHRLRVANELLPVS